MRAIALLAAAIIAATPAPTSVVELQPFREATSGPLDDGHGRRGTATLVNLNPHVNAWFLLRLDWTDPDEREDYHLENAAPDGQRLALDGNSDVSIAAADGRHNCHLWSGPPPDNLQRARASRLPYAPLCDQRLYLRNPVAGTYTLLERMTNLLRDHVWGGDAIVTFVREHAYRDAFIERARPAAPSARPLASAQAPRAALVRDADAGVAVDPPDLGLDVDSASPELLLGQWYPVRDAAGIYFSLMRPGAVPDEIQRANRGTVNALDPVESAALDYLVAMDLAQFELHFALGTDHPRLGWSERSLEAVRDAQSPGPDGIATAAPLVPNGMVSPALAARTVATFAAGFKREHGAFRYGALALRNHGSHYGFIERGVVFSRLQPDLATLFSRTDGSVDMKTWTDDDAASLQRVADARQNGVALIGTDPVSGEPAPGPLVNQWGAGNWSGSESEQLRTLRAGACLQQTATRRFLVYGFFSTATPSAMTRVFQAYGCRYAMLLDMNALEHTYFALYTHPGGRVLVQHLIEGMAVVDRKGGDQTAPRFLGFPDDRDFFYMTRRGPAP